MSAIPPIVERCKNCGAELGAESPLCWLCRAPREGGVVASEAPPRPGFVISEHSYTYIMIFAATFLLAATCFGVAIVDPNWAGAAIAIGLLGGVVLFFLLVRAVMQRRGKRDLTRLDQLLSAFAYFYIAVVVTILVLVAAVIALVLFCFALLYAQ